MWGKKIWGVLFINLVFVLASCQLLDPKLQLTPEGIPRKVVVRQDHTELFDAPELSKVIQYAKQWEIYYLFDEGPGYFVISPSKQYVAENSYYVSKQDVFEWNSYLALAYANSPDETNRKPTIFYSTLDGVIQENEDDAILLEKPIHEASFNPTNAMPILRENEESIYYIAALYDNLDTEGEYIFLGSYDFGYVRYNPKAHQFRRLVSKDELDDQMLALLDSTGKAKANMNPSELDEVYGGISDLLAEFESGERGAQEIIRAFSGNDLPDEAQEGIFTEEMLRGNDWEEMDSELQQMFDMMKEYSLDSSNWDGNGIGFVPAEWMNTQ